jgi:hypothetical protein
MIMTLRLILLCLLSFLFDLEDDGNVFLRKVRLSPKLFLAISHKPTTYIAILSFNLHLSN